MILRRKVGRNRSQYKAEMSAYNAETLFTKKKKMQEAVGEGIVTFKMARPNTVGAIHTQILTCAATLI